MANLFLRRQKPAAIQPPEPVTLTPVQLLLTQWLQWLVSMAPSLPKEVSIFVPSVARMCSRLIASMTPEQCDELVRIVAQGSEQLTIAQRIQTTIDNGPDSPAAD